MQRLAEGMLGEGERLFPKLVNGEVIDLNDVAEKIESNTSFKRGDVIGVLTEFVEQMRYAIADGKSVRMDGLGLFSPVLGLVEKERRGDWQDASGRTTTGRNVRLKTIKFRPDKQLMRTLQTEMELVKMDDSAVSGASSVASTVEERAEMARKYLSENGYMRVADYVALTHLPYSSAAKELRELALDEQSGISAKGTGAGKLYVATS